MWSRCGVLITDPDGYIIFFGESNGKFLGMDPKAQIGKQTTEVFENSRMHIVAKTGIPEIFHPHQIMGRNQIVQRIPIFIDGKLKYSSIIPGQADYFKEIDAALKKRKKK